ncbi:MAG: RNA-binding domain-containing protein [Candidatus Methanoperedens sp.]|nr:RNA-binding domain-containing protein [Candidatus Methanoperedens sp.]
MNIHNVSLRAFIHATESEDRVKTALSLFLFDNEIETIKTEGHFGNPITILQVHVKGRDCRRFIELLKTKLPEHELGRLKKELGKRIDDNCYFHIRFDKQAAYKGIVQLATTTDTIAADIKLKAYPAKRENAVAAAEGIF